MKIWEIDLSKDGKKVKAFEEVWEVRNGDLRSIEDLSFIEKYRSLKALLETDFEPVVDWSEIEVDTPILTSSDGENWTRRYFAEYKGGKIYAWNNGCTRWTSEGVKTFWKYAKLPTEDELKKII